MQKYTVEELEKLFEEHTKKAKLNQKKDLESFKVKFPEEPVPENFLDDFCISEALQCICQEIIKLKK